MCTDILNPNEMKLVSSIKMKLGDNQEFYCGVLSFLGTPGNTFGYFLDYLRKTISDSSEASKENQLLPSIHNKKLKNQLKRLESLTEEEGKVLERLGRSIVEKDIDCKGLVEYIFFQ